MIRLYKLLWIGPVARTGLGNQCVTLGALYPAQLLVPTWIPVTGVGLGDQCVTLGALYPAPATSTK